MNNAINKTEGRFGGMSPEQIISETVFDDKPTFRTSRCGTARQMDRDLKKDAERVLTEWASGRKPKDIADELQLPVEEIYRMLRALQRAILKNHRY
jgi:hypothetical protein